MRRTLLVVGALALVLVSAAQTPSPSQSQSSWQLGQGFDVTLPQNSSSAGVSATTPAPPSTSPTPVGQPLPTEPSSPQNSRDLKSSATISHVEGSIWLLTFVKTKPGLTEDYFKLISASLKPLYEEEKKQKLILDYKILSADSADERDFNVIIMVEYPNMAALKARERIEPIIDKILGPANARHDMATKRLEVREVLATKMMREIWLK